MHFSVYLKGQALSECPPHRATRTIAKLVLAHSLAEPVGQNAIRLTREWTWKEVKAYARHGGFVVWADDGPTAPDVLLPPLDYYLPYNFPLPYSLLKMYERHRYAG